MACTRRILKQKPRLAISMSVKAPPAEKERIIVGRPLPFSVFGAEGQLLLAEGSVVESDRARQMLLRKGVYRDAVNGEDTTPDTNVQLPDRRSHGFERRDTDRRIKSAEQCVIPDTFHQTRPKTVPKEVKFDVRIGTFSLPVFAINDLSFRRMQFQVALRQSDLKRDFECC